MSYPGEIKLNFLSGVQLIKEGFSYRAVFELLMKRKEIGSIEKGFLRELQTKCSVDQSLLMRINWEPNDNARNLDPPEWDSFDKYHQYVTGLVAMVFNRNGIFDKWEMSRAKQQMGESIDDWGDRLWNIVLKARPLVKCYIEMEREVLTSFIEGLGNQKARHFLKIKQPTTMREAKLMLLLWQQKHDSDSMEFDHVPALSQQRELELLSRSRAGVRYRNVENAINREGKHWMGQQLTHASKTPERVNPNFECVDGEGNSKNYGTEIGKRVQSSSDRLMSVACDIYWEIEGNNKIPNPNGNPTALNYGNLNYENLKCVAVCFHSMGSIFRENMVYDRGRDLKLQCAAKMVKRKKRKMEKSESLATWKIKQ